MRESAVERPQPCFPAHRAAHAKWPTKTIPDGKSGAGV
jgi:hypothetical protein